MGLVAQLALRHVPSQFVHTPLIAQGRTTPLPGFLSPKENCRS